MKKKRGFTLIELLVAIVILGIIVLMAIPQISNLVDSNNDAKFKAYEKTVLSSAKLYVDSYTEDIFGNNESGCYDVGYFDMEKKNLIKDINVLNATCNGGDQKKTFVRVLKSGDHYKYKVSLYCTDKINKATVLYSNTIDSSIDGDNTICDGKTSDAAGPNIEIISSKDGWISPGTSFEVKIKITDDFGLLENQQFKYAWTTSLNNITSWKNITMDNERFATSVTYRVTDIPTSANSDYYLVVAPVDVRDANGNHQTETVYKVFLFDNTPPSCSIEVTGTEGDNDWYTSDVEVKLTYSDERGTVSKYGLTTSTTASYNTKEKDTQGETASQVWYGYVKDGAGHTYKCESKALKVDKTAPTAPTKGSFSVSGSDPNATVNKASGAKDELSGIAEYRYYVLNNSTKPKSNDTGFQAMRGFVRSCGTKYYAYAIAVDNAGNKSPVYYMGNDSDGKDEYSEWTACTKKCGSGTQTRTNTCALNTTDLSRTCNEMECCEKVTYVDGTACSTKCVDGTYNQLAYSAYDSSVRCASQDKTSGGSTCNVGGCCDKVIYKDGTSCSKKCGSGTYNQLAYSYYDNSKRCSDYDTTSGGSSCNTQDCCSEVTYTNGTTCSAKCGGGSYNRIAYSKFDSSVRCASQDKTTGGGACNKQTCCSQVNYGDWSKWSSCSATCGGGTKTRTRTKTSKYDGSSCGIETDSEDCNTHSCCQTVHYTTAGTYCSSAGKYFGTAWTNLEVCTGNGTGCTAATSPKGTCEKMGGTYFYFRYCP